MSEDVQQLTRRGETTDNKQRPGTKAGLHRSDCISNQDFSAMVVPTDYCKSRLSGVQFATGSPKMETSHEVLVGTALRRTGDPRWPQPASSLEAA
jgi:hypothetical protein